LKRLANIFIFDSVTVANVRLTPTTAQAKPLRNTLECRNAGCNPISQRGFDAGAPRQYALQFVTYKAALRGMPVVAIDPHNTRRACPECGSIHKANRKTQQTFSCTDCGYTTAADFGGARNIQAFGTRV
jgi:predicted RNA-binding Zn-ribbon protein involved in translation (DUF1610 family)